MFTVYVLRSLVNNRFYTGQTNDLHRRLEEHNSGSSEYTRLTRPFVLVHTEEYKTRKEAVRRERMLKHGQGRSWLKNRYG
ncbi:MAG: GIY-YIG nuclease family protein [bacterium]